MTRSLICAGLLAVGLGLAGCSSSAGSASGTHPAHTSSHPASPGKSRTTKDDAAKTKTAAITLSPARFGATLTGTDRGLVFRIRLSKVLDPAHPEAAARPIPKGERLVGAKFVITETKGLLYDDIENDTLMLGSDNRTYEPTLLAASGCRELSTLVLKARASAVGCVNFLLPKGVKVRIVEFQANAGTANNIEAWKV